MADAGLTVFVGGAGGGGIGTSDNRAETFHAASPTFNVGGERVAVGTTDNRFEAAFPAPDPPPAADTIDPVIDNFSPANGTTVVASDPVFLDVTDDSGLFRRVIIAVTQGDVTELAHDGDTFLPPYDAISTRINIANGFQYRLRRAGGWNADVTVRAFAIDLAGNEAT